VFLLCRFHPSGCRPAELETELLLARMVGGDAPVDLLGGFRCIERRPVSG
jgi:hypothetical protein